MITTRKSAIVHVLVKRKAFDTATAIDGKDLYDHASEFLARMTGKSVNRSTLYVERNQLSNDGLVGVFPVSGGTRYYLAKQPGDTVEVVKTVELSAEKAIHSQWIDALATLRFDVETVTAALAQAKVDGNNLNNQMKAALALVNAHPIPENTAHLDDLVKKIETHKSDLLECERHLEEKNRQISEITGKMTDMIATMRNVL